MLHIEVARDGQKVINLSRCADCTVQAQLTSVSPARSKVGYSNDIASEGLLSQPDVDPFPLHTFQVAAICTTIQELIVWCEDAL